MQFDGPICQEVHTLESNTGGSPSPGAPLPEDQPKQDPGTDILTLVETGVMDRKSRFVDLRAKGVSYSRCAKLLKTGKNTVVRWGQELEREISALKAVEIEALHERCHMLRVGRMRMLNAHFERLRKEVEERDLQGVSTAKLHELMLDFYREMKTEADACGPAAQPQGAETIPGTGESTAWISQEIARLYRRYDSGDLGHDQFRERIATLLLLLKAREQTAVEAKLADLEARVAGMAS